MPNGDENATLMELNEEYEILAGDAIEPFGEEETLVEVRHVLLEDTSSHKFVTLRRGEIYLIAGDNTQGE